MKLTELFLNRFLYRDSKQNLETKDAVYDASNVIPAPVPALAAGSAAQDINTGNVNISGETIEPGTIPPATLDVSNWGWGQTCVFSSTDLNTVSWGAGTFKSANGVTYSISAGNTGNMAGKNYIYLDLNVSNTAYQITTNPATAVGVGKVLIAVANPDTTAATFNLTEATQITGDNILANSINASKIVTGQLIVGTNVGLGTAQDSAGVTVIIGNTVTTGFVNALSVVAGSVAAENITGTYITGKIIRTSALTTVNRVVISGPNNDIEFWNEDDELSGVISTFYTAIPSPTSGVEMSGGGGSYVSLNGRGSMGYAVLGLTNKTFGLTWDSNDAATERIYNDAEIDSDWIPYINASYDLGSSTKKWDNLYMNGNIIIAGTVDGVDISAHVAEASAHHSSTSNGLNITPATVTSGNVLPNSSNDHDLGSTSYYWNNLYTDYIRFNGSYGQIYWGSDLILDIYSTYTIWKAHFDPYGAGSYNMGGSTRYWYDISYKTLTDRGCLGWFDDGVELQDGKVVSDLEALESIKKHPTLKTIYGTPRLDYRTMPKCIYRKATDHDGNVLERDKDDKPFIIDKKTKKKIYAEDGAETTALISIMLGSIKELNAKIKKLESK
jgi:hypothetical protein